MAILSTAIDNINPTKVKITWTAPFDSYEPIDEYKILLLKSDGTYVEDETNCGGSDPAILFCYIPMSTIRTLTSQPLGTLIAVKSQAHNLNGWSQFSQLNTLGAVIETEPDQMTDLRFDIQNSDNTNIIV